MSRRLVLVVMVVVVVVQSQIKCVYPDVSVFMVHLAMQYDAVVTSAWEKRVSWCSAGVWKSGCPLAASVAVVPDEGRLS